jgi:hypothetical protein
MTYSKALTSPNSTKWFKAMKFGIDFLYQNQIWNLIRLLKGYKQVYKIDCDETFLQLEYLSLSKFHGLKPLCGVRACQNFTVSHRNTIF